MASRNGRYSSSFNSSNGTKLSPILVYIEMDELLYKLTVSIEDFSLLSLNKGLVSIMLDICEDISKKYDVVFNSRKC